jgi:hypothetical protein
MSGHLEVRLSGRVPAPQTVARQLWIAGVYGSELLAVAERWPTLDTAWEHCARLELVIPLAVLRARPMVDVVRVARDWVLTARERIGDLGWPVEDRRLAAGALAASIAPDVDVVRLAELRDRALERAGQRADGRHRYRLLTAVAHTANLGVRRVRTGFGAAADGELVAEHLIGALEEAEATQQGDLFATPVDSADWYRGALLSAMEALT